MTIECDDVVFDLNGHTLEQSKVFYLQQRFFSVFLLNNKNFIAGQGPAFFGAHMATVSNVVIKNGVIGRSSHHGIFGHQPRNLLIEDVVIRDFDVAGVSLSGFQGVVLRGLDIGPNNHDCPVTGRYLHARAMLPRYKMLVEEHGDESLVINGAERQIDDIIDRLVDAMDMIFNEYVYGQQYDADDELYQMAQREFATLPYGSARVPDGGAVYGILLNGYGGAVMGFGSAPRFATNVSVHNISIHAIPLRTIEKNKFSFSDSPLAIRGPFADIFDADAASSVGEDGALFSLSLSKSTLRRL